MVLARSELSLTAILVHHKTRQQEHAAIPRGTLLAQGATLFSLSLSLFLSLLFAFRTSLAACAGRTT